MSWWDTFRKGLSDEISNTDRRVAGEVESFIEEASASGATTDKDRQARWDAYVAGLPPAERAALIAKVEDERAQLEAMLVNSGYKGDVEGMTFLELAELAANRGLLDMSGDGELPTSSALEAAAAATRAGGNWALNPLTGEIVIFKDSKGTVVHETIPGGHDARPAEIVEGEILGGSDRGEARPTREQLAEAARIQENNPGSGVGFGDDGAVTVTRTDGTVITVRNNPFQQGLEDLQASAGDIRGIADALGGAATRTIDNLADGISDALERAKPSFGGGAAAGMGGTGSPSAGVTPTSSTPAKTPSSSGQPSSGYQPPSSSNTGSDPSLDVDAFDFTSGRKPASTSTSSSTTNQPAEPASTEPNEIVQRSGETPSQSDNDNGYRPSTITPPTDATGKNSEDRDSGKAEQPQPDSDGDGIPDDEDEDTDILGYTPAPGDDERRDYDEEDLERMAEAAAARGERYDRPAIKAPEYDPDFAARLQARKLGMIGNPGDPDNDNVVPSGGLPDQNLPIPDPDDDTPGHDTDGVDTGAEDPMLNPPQGTLDPSILEDDAAPTLAPQETAIAEIDPALSAPLATSVEAEVNIEGTPAIPGYHYAIGDPVSTAPPAEDEEPIAARTDTRLGGQLSIASSFRLPAKDADDEEEPAG